MKKTGLLLLLGMAALLLAGNVEAQVLIGGWDFSTTTTGGTPVRSATSVLNANFGQGTIYLDGTDGSSAWNMPDEATAVSGTPLNGLSGWSAATTGTSALGVNNSAGSKSISFAFSMEGYKDLSISYAARRSSVLSFPTHFWEYSADGVNWSTLQSVTGPPASTSVWEVLTLSPTAALDGDATAFLRLTFQGATNPGASSVTRLDNFQLNATAVPEPGTYALMAIGLGGLIALRLRKRRNGLGA